MLLINHKKTWYAAHHITPFHMQLGRRHQPIPVSVLSVCFTHIRWSDSVCVFYERSIQKATMKEFIALIAWDTCSRIRVTPESNTDYCAIIGIAAEIRMLCE